MNRVVLPRSPFDAPTELVKPAPAFLVTLLEVARSQVGVKEDRLRKNRGPQVDEYLRSVGLDPTRGSYAWCFALCYWSARETAKRLAVPNPCQRTGGVMKAWANTSARRKIPVALARMNPTIVQPGWIFIEDHTGAADGQGAGHAGFVEGPIVDGNIPTIEGNTARTKKSREGDGVYDKMDCRLHDSRLLGFIDLSAAA